MLLRQPPAAATRTATDPENNPMNDLKHFMPDTPPSSPEQRAELAGLAGLADGLALLDDESKD